MPVPPAFTVARPATRPHVPVLVAASVLAPSWAGVLLAEQWPLAPAVDHVLTHHTTNGLVLLSLSGIAVVLLNALVTRSRSRR